MVGKVADYLGIRQCQGPRDLRPGIATAAHFGHHLGIDIGPDILSKDRYAQPLFSSRNRG